MISQTPSHVYVVIIWLTRRKNIHQNISQEAEGRMLSPAGLVGFTAGRGLQKLSSAPRALARLQYEIWKMKNQKSEMRTVQILFITHFWLQFPTQLFSRDKCCKVIITLLWHLTHPRSTNWLKKINWLVDLEMNCTISFNITRRKLDSYRYAHPRAPKIVNDRS